MKTKLCCLAVTLSATIVMGSGSTLLAAEGYTVDSQGQTVTSGFGECVQTGTWTSDLSIPECDPALAARLEAERLAAEDARRAAEMAALERSAPVTTLRISDKSNVMFKFDSAMLTPAAARDLNDVLSQIHGLDDVEGIEIVGHTDSTGPDSYNQSLSERRAESVRRFLESRGVAGFLMESRGKGETEPVADNSSREGRARNRRVDILVSGDVVE